MNSTAILEVKGLAIDIDKKPLIRDLDFTLERGENLAVIGPNGAGKTLLIKALLGNFPYKGAVAWAPDIRLGYVPQKIEADRHLPLSLNNLMLAKLEILRLPREELEKTLRAVGITNEIFHTPVGHLSGGQFQKALIAFALLGRPNVLIFDEPTASIDERGEEEIYELVGRLQKEYRLTVILVSHELSVVYQYATRVLCLGRTHAHFGSPIEVLTPQNLESLYGAARKYHHHSS